MAGMQEMQEQFIVPAVETSSRSTVNGYSDDIKKNYIK